MHTEDEAKKKWCPMVRTGLTAGMAVNHHIAGDVDAETRCIASGCMMWRCGEWEEYDPAKGDPKPVRGFCGLSRR